MITSATPTDWRDLQDQVAGILSECGFTVEVEKTVLTARGEVEIDVFAEEDVKGRHYTILCECKHWKSRVPKSVIHGFRTVISDIGANRGYIISSSGFQAGAACASEFTNLDLVTWTEFQEQFQETWLENYFSPTIMERLDRLMGFTEPLVQRWMCEIPDDEVEVVKSLRSKYIGLAVLVMTFTTYSSFLRKEGFPSLPLRKRLTERYDGDIQVPDAVLDANGYREFFEAALSYGEKGIEEFQAVRERNNV